MGKWYSSISGLPGSALHCRNASVDELHSKYKTIRILCSFLLMQMPPLRKSTVFMKQRNFDLPVYAYQSNPPSDWFEGSLPTTVVIG